ncbi:MAG: DUF2812 domain-containing protein [Sedimentibacter sp.]
MKNKCKWVFWGFFSLDYQVMKTYLEEMAEKGWMLEKVGRSIAKFRAIEPQKLKFYVDVFKEGGPLDPEKTEESEAYRSLCKESGWIFITSHVYLQFFYADEDSVIIPIQTEEALEQKIMEHTLLKNELRGIIIFSVIAAYIIIKILPRWYTILLSFTGVTGAFLLPILYIFAVVPAAYNIIRILKARSNLKKSLPIEKPTVESARRRMIIFYCSSWIIQLLLVLSFIVDAFFRPATVVFALLGPGVGMIVGLGSRYYIKKKATKREDGLLAIIVAVIVVIIFMYTIGSFIIEELDDTYKVTLIPEGYPIITMEEISKEPSQISSLTKEFKPGSSPVTPKHYTYWESVNVNGNKEYLDIKYYKAINPYYAEIIFNGIRDNLEKGFKWKGMTIFNRTIISDEDMKNLWDADNMVLTQEYDEVIIQKGSVVLRFSGDIDFRDKQTRELIISRFFSDSSVGN